MRLGTVRIHGTAPRLVGLAEDGAHVVDVSEAALALGLVGGPSDDPLPGSLLRLLQFGRYGDQLVSDLEKSVNGRDLDREPWAFDLDAATFLAPVPRPGKLLLIGGNKSYPGDPIDADIQDQWPRPIYFEKSPTSVSGHGGTVEAWQVMRPVQIEGELCLIIGKKGRHVPAEDAWSIVAGCSLLNDMSAGRFGLQDGMAIYVARAAGQEKELMVTRSMTRAKVPDAMCPIGPWMVPISDLGVPFESLEVTTTVGGHVVQKGCVSDYGFSAEQIIEEITKWITLEPGDVVSLGQFTQMPDFPLRAVDAAAEGMGRIVISCPQLGDLETAVTLVDA